MDYEFMLNILRWRNLYHAQNQYFRNQKTFFFSSKNRKGAFFKKYLGLSCIGYILAEDLKKNSLQNLCDVSLNWVQSASNCPSEVWKIICKD